MVTRRKRLAGIVYRFPSTPINGKFCGHVCSRVFSIACHVQLNIVPLVGLPKLNLFVTKVLLSIVFLRAVEKAFTIKKINIIFSVWFRSTVSAVAYSSAVPTLVNQDTGYCI